MKKKKTARKRKIKKADGKKQEQPIVDEIDGWKLGEKVYGKRYQTEKLIHGEIHQLHPKDSVGPAVTIHDEINGGFRTVLISSLSRTKPKRKNKTTLGKLYSKSLKK